MVDVVDFIKTWGALIVATASLLIAIISLIKSAKAQKLQNKINKIELSIKQHELDKIAIEKAEATRSCVEARVIQISNNKWKLKVWNSGNVKVFNVNAILEDGSEIIMVDSKMPFDELEPNKSFEEHLIVHMGSARKFKITTSWTDEQGNKQEKVQMASL